MIAELSDPKEHFQAVEKRNQSTEFGTSNALCLRKLVWILKENENFAEAQELDCYAADTRWQRGQGCTKGESHLYILQLSLMY